jgi:hypothetical protein
MPQKLTAAANAAAHSVVALLDEAYAFDILEDGYPPALREYLAGLDAPIALTIGVYVNVPAGTASQNGYASSRYVLAPTQRAMTAATSRNDR